jgi:hypothetical protein
VVVRGLRGGALRVDHVRPGAAAAQRLVGGR